MRKHTFSLLVSLLMFCPFCGASAEALRDPTLPLSYRVTAAKEPKLVLQAIYVRANGNQAVINGQLVRVGQSVENMRILDITKNKVSYRNSKGLTRNITLRENIFE